MVEILPRVHRMRIFQCLDVLPPLPGEARCRTLEEMDNYFRTTHRLVPFAKEDKVGMRTREVEMAKLTRPLLCVSVLARTAIEGREYDGTEKGYVSQEV